MARHVRYGLWIAKHRGRREGDGDLVFTDLPKGEGIGQMLSIRYHPGWRSLRAQLGSGRDGTIVEFWDSQNEPRAADFLDTRYRIQEVKGGGGDVVGVLRAIKAAYDRVVALGPMGSVDPVTGSI